MPCYEVRTMSVEFKTKHLNLLQKAIESLGWRYEGISGGLSRGLMRVETGTSQFMLDLVSQTAVLLSGQRSQLNQLKQQYSKEALKRAAKLQGWQYKQQEQSKGVLRK